MKVLVMLACMVAVYAGSYEAHAALSKDTLAKIAKHARRLKRELGLSEKEAEEKATQAFLERMGDAQVPEGLQEDVKAEEQGQKEILDNVEKPDVEKPKKRRGRPRKVALGDQPQGVVDNILKDQEIKADNVVEDLDANENLLGDEQPNVEKPKKRRGRPRKVALGDQPQGVVDNILKAQGINADNVRALAQKDDLEKVQNVVEDEENEALQRAINDFDKHHYGDEKKDEIMQNVQLGKIDDNEEEDEGDDKVLGQNGGLQKFEPKFEPKFEQKFEPKVEDDSFDLDKFAADFEKRQKEKYLSRKILNEAFPEDEGGKKSDGLNPLFQDIALRKPHYVYNVLESDLNAANKVEPQEEGRKNRGIVSVFDDDYFISQKNKEVPKVQFDRGKKDYFNVDPFANLKKFEINPVEKRIQVGPFGNRNPANFLEVVNPFRQVNQNENLFHKKDAEEAPDPFANLKKFEINPNGSDDNDVSRKYPVVKDLL